MPERFKFSLSSMWLFISFFTIILPVFIPSSAFSVNPSSNAIGVATAAMFILSFPSSLFGLVAMFFAQAAFSLRLESMEAMYVNLLVMFALGLVQWFWIVPRIWSRDPALQTVEIGPGWTPRGALPRAVPDEIFGHYDALGRTPVECIIDERSKAETTDRHHTN